MSAQQIVDSHVHLWDPATLDYPWLAGTDLDRAFSAQDLKDASGDEVAGIVVVQADCASGQALAEVDWISAQLRERGRLAGIVAFASIELGPEVKPFLRLLRSMPQVVGVRRLLQDERRGFALEPNFLTGLELLGGFGLPFDVCVRAPQLPDVIEFVRRVPGTTFVLDHLGKPAVGRPDDRWRDNLSSLAASPNVVCKLSGLSTEITGAPWSSGLVRPYLAHALDVFGPGRCLFGSDWPVLTTAITYLQWLEAVVDVLREFTEAEMDLVMSGNARSVYGLVGPHVDAT